MALYSVCAVSKVSIANQVMMERLELSETQVEVTHVSQRRARNKLLTSHQLQCRREYTRRSESFSALTLRRTYDGSAEMTHDETFTVDSRAVLVCVSVLV